MTIDTDLATLRVEQLARKFHEIYQAEAKRQGDVRHHDDYDALPENIKEFDRVLARYVETELARLREEVDGMARAPYGEYQKMREERDEARQDRNEYIDIAEREAASAETAERELARLRDGLREYANPGNWDLDDGPPFVWVKDSDPPRIARDLLADTPEDEQ